MRPVVEPFYTLPVYAATFTPSPRTLGLNPAACDAYIKTLETAHANRHVLMFHAPDLGLKPDTPALGREYFRADTVLHSIGDVAMLTGAPVAYVNRDRERILIEFRETDIWTEVQSYELGKIVPGTPDYWTYKTGGHYYRVVL